MSFAFRYRFSSWNWQKLDQTLSAEWTQWRKWTLAPWNLQIPHSAGKNSFSSSSHPSLICSQRSISSTIQLLYRCLSIKGKGYSRNHENEWILGCGPWSGFCVVVAYLNNQNTQTHTYMFCNKKENFSCIFTTGFGG